jgi:hypothetical protein
MTVETANHYATAAEEHLAAYRLAVREKRAVDAKREFRLQRAAMDAARAISTYEHERGK